jgi:hypothetical protein
MLNGTFKKYEFQTIVRISTNVVLFFTLRFQDIQAVLLKLEHELRLLL